MSEPILPTEGIEDELDPLADVPSGTLLEQLNQPEFQHLSEKVKLALVEAMSKELPSLVNIRKYVDNLCGKGHVKVDGKCPSCGRPTKYTTDEDMIAKVDEYLESCKDEDYRLVKSEGDKSTSWDNKIKVNLPTLDGFSLMLGINNETLVQCRKEHLKFSAACKKIEVEQRNRLITKGLSGEYVPIMAKFVLSANHGMKERSDITTNDKDMTIGQVLDQLEPKE